MREDMVARAERARETTSEDAGTRCAAAVVLTTNLLMGTASVMVASSLLLRSVLAV